MDVDDGPRIWKECPECDGDGWVRYSACWDCDCVGGLETMACCAPCKTCGAHFDELDEEKTNETKN